MPLNTHRLRRTLALFAAAASLATTVAPSSMMKAPLTPVAPVAGRSSDTFRPVVRGRRGVIAGGHPLAVEAGMRLLQRGGNAVDAGVAAVLAASVIEFSHFSFGGEVPVLIKLRGRDVAVVEGMGAAPSKATREFFVGRAKDAGTAAGVIPSTGPLAATVPAVFDACAVALAEFGTKSLAEVMQPAVELADGHPIDELRVQYIRTRSPVFARWPDARRVFMPGGEAPKVGDIFAQPDLARTLRELIEAERRAARRGRRAAIEAARDYFYRGPLGKRIGDFMQQNGGLLGSEDLARFRAKVGRPARGTYRGYEVYKPGFWTQGPVMIEALNLLAGFDLRAMGHNSADYVHTVAEALKLGFADRDRYYGDPDFVRVPERELLSEEYAALRRALIDRDRASQQQRPGDPAHMKPLAETSRAQPNTGAPAVPPLERANDTTCVNVVDKDGNLFSATPSGAWLPAVVAGDTGVLMTQRLQSALLEEGHPNVVAPGKRPRITLSPTLVTRGGEPFMILSTPGGDNQDQALLQVMLNVVEFGMNPQEAVEAPRFDTQHLVSSFDEHRFDPASLNLEARFPEETADRLKARGHRLRIQGAWGTLSAPTVIIYDPRTGVAAAGADPRRGRYAVAW